MKSELLEKLVGILPGGQLLDRSESERLNILAREIEEDDWRGDTRVQRLMRVQADVKEIVFGALDRLVDAGLDYVEGGILLAKSSGESVDPEDSEIVAAVGEVVTLMADMRTGRKIVEPKDCFSGSFLVEEVAA